MTATVQKTDDMEPCFLCSELAPKTKNKLTVCESCVFHINLRLPASRARPSPPDGEAQPRSHGKSTARNRDESAPVGSVYVRRLDRIHDRPLDGKVDQARTRCGYPTHTATLPPLSAA